jgi:hypothetical protein
LFFVVVSVPMSIRRRPLLLVVFLLICGIVAWLGLSWLERDYQGSGANYSLIELGLYMGGVVREPPSGTVAVLNLCELDDPYRCEVHRWEPTHDGEPAPELAWLRRQIEFIDMHRKNDHTVFVHCRNGVSRSGLVVVAYLMWEHGWSCDDALKFAREKRSIVRPNPVFMDRLAEWEKALGADSGARH